MQLSNHTILITGGTKGIGLALAKRFLQLGNQVIITGRNTEDLTKLKRELPSLITFCIDLNIKTQLDELVLFIEQQYPRLNILINNAGVQYNYNFLETMNPSEKVQQEIQTNLLAPILLTTHLLPLLQENNNPAIINISSALALVPKKSAPIYCSTKAGIHIFSKALRYQMDKVKIFEVIPPLVDTSMTESRSGKKISTTSFVDQFIKGFQKDRYEINIGKVGILRLLQRISPKLADNILKNG